jgi:hypothetical protein
MESFKNAQIFKAYFNFLLNKNLLIDTLLTNHIFKGMSDSVDVYVQQAIQIRSELKQFDYLLQAADQSLAMH